MNIQISPDKNDYYKPGPELLAAINTALFLKRPLLLSGEPGTGKTECADFVTRQVKQLYPDTFTASTALRFNTKSVTQSTDLFYSYDAVAHFGDKTNRDKESFISFNSLGIALLATQDPQAGFQNFSNYGSQVVKRNPPSGSVVLIDEIDKAPRDFPNDLLSELEKPPFKFSIKEVHGTDIVQNPEFPVVVIITSNNEKALPDAFLRRCVFHYIKFPEEQDLLKIVTSHLKLENDHVETAIARFLELRRSNISKRPATSELIDWIACLQYKNLLDKNLADWKKADLDYRQNLLSTLGILAKSRTDFETLSQTIAG